MSRRGVLRDFGDPATTVRGKPFREIRNRTVHGKLEGFLAHSLVAASLKLDEVGEDDRPCPRVDVSISPAAGRPLYQETDCCIHVIRGAKESETPQRKRLVDLRPAW